MKHEALLCVLHLVWARDRKSGKLPPAPAGLGEWSARLILATTGEGGKRTKRNRGRGTVGSQWPPNQTCLLGPSLGVGIGEVLHLQGDLLCVDGTRNHIPGSLGTREDAGLSSISFVAS